MQRRAQAYRSLIGNPTRRTDFASGATGEFVTQSGAGLFSGLFESRDYVAVIG